MRSGVPWGEFARQQPTLAEHACRLFQRGDAVASAFLATVSPQGRPRLHPVFPVFGAQGLWLFIVEMSPKHDDLLVNGHFALHALPPESGGEEFALQGTALRVDDAGIRADVVAATGDRQGNHAFERLFHCTVTTALHTRWAHWGTAVSWPSYDKWRASAAAH